jgi:chemotaxis protein MotB
MQRFSVALVMALVGVTCLAAVGCVSEDAYRALQLRNNTQATLLVEKDAQLTQLNERVGGLQAQVAARDRAVADRDEYVAALTKMNKEYETAYKAMWDAYKKLAERPVPTTGAGLTESTIRSLQALADQYVGLIELDPATGQLRFKGDVTFDLGSDAVKAEAKAALTKLGEILSTADGKQIKVDIVGHTDNLRVSKQTTIAMLTAKKKQPNNQGLSEARAEAVAEVLKAAKVEAGRVTTKGVGEVQPIADNKTADGQARNRRVEILLSGSASPAPASTTPATKPAPKTGLPLE